MTKSSLLRSDSERKFTPPTEFPAEYVDGNGDKAVILGRAPNELFPFIGYTRYGDEMSWTDLGATHSDYTSPYDLHDTSKRITTWHNVYDNWVSSTYFTRSHADEHYDACKEFSPRPRLCVYRIERDEDGGNPEIFVEEV